MRKYISSFALASLLGFPILSLSTGSATAQTVARDDASLIASWYQRYLGRTPAASEVAGWLPGLRSGQNVEAAILGSDEYYQRQGSNPASFVTSLYVNVLSRQPSGQEVQGWLDQLAPLGFDRTALAEEFLGAAQYELSTRVQSPLIPWHHWWRKH
jgi:hypothetical protein